MEDVSTFEKFLLWMFSPENPGALIVVMWGVSWGLEEFDFWHKIHPKVKSLIVLGLALVLGVGSYLIYQNKPLITALAPYFGIVTVTVGGWLALQTFHKLDKALTGGGKGRSG